MKRVFDIVFVSVAILILILPILFIGLAVRLKLGKPVIFIQRRPGLQGRIFSMIKFRSMSDARDAAGDLLPDEHRVGNFGRLLRASSLDELPELWNVLKGDMSLVGPRPLLVEYLPLYSAEQRRRHELRPGITGWAQINGRNALSWEEKFKLDVWYIENHTIWLDIRILWLTVCKVLVRDGINAAGEVPVTRFTGSLVDRSQ